MRKEGKYKMTVSTKDLHVFLNVTLKLKIHRKDETFTTSFSFRKIENDENFLNDDKD